MYKNLKTHLKRDFPHGRPENQIATYLINQREKNCAKGFPEKDTPPEETKIKLNEAYQKLYEIETKLKKLQAEAELRRKKLDNQWEDLERKEEQFKSNAEKRERLEHKIQADIELAASKVKQTETLKTKFNNLLNVKAKMEDLIAKHTIYEDFLQQVVDVSPDFRNVEDVLRRYESLMQTRDIILTRQESELSILETAQIDITVLLQQRTEETMDFANKISLLNLRYEAAKQKTKYWEHIVEKIREHNLNTLAEIEQIKETAWNIYQRMCYRKGKEPKFEKWDVENHLIYIKTTLNHLEIIVTEASKKAAKVKLKKKVKMAVAVSQEVEAIWTRPSLDNCDSDYTEESRSSSNTTTPTE